MAYDTSPYNLQKKQGKVNKVRIDENFRTLALVVFETV